MTKMHGEEVRFKGWNAWCIERTTDEVTLHDVATINYTQYILNNHFLVSLKVACAYFRATRSFTALP